MFDDLFQVIGTVICEVAHLIGANRYVFRECGDPISVAHHWLGLAGLILVVEELIRRNKGKGGTE